MGIKETLKAMLEPNPDPRPDVWRPETIRVGWRLARGTDRLPEE